MQFYFFHKKNTIVLYTLFIYYTCLIKIYFTKELQILYHSSCIIYLFVYFLISVTIATKEWGRVRLQHLPVKGLSERSYHRGLFLHVTPATSESMSRMQVYLDCKWQGYFMMPLSLYQMAKEAAGNKLRAVSINRYRYNVLMLKCLQKKKLLFLSIMYTCMHVRNFLKDHLTIRT